MKSRANYARGSPRLCLGFRPAPIQSEQYSPAAAREPAPTHAISVLRAPNARSFEKADIMYNEMLSIKEQREFFILF